MSETPDIAASGNRMETGFTETDEFRDLLVGALVAARRQRLGISQKRLCTTLGIASSTLSRFEAGLMTVRADDLLRLLDTLRLRLSDVEQIVAVARDKTLLIRKALDSSQPEGLQWSQDLRLALARLAALRAMDELAVPMESTDG